MQFLYQPLTWGFFLVLIPLLIHLINLMRQRRVKWAAMEFLLAAYKKHRKWIWLKQWLLLLARMLAIAAIVAMLAHLVTRDQWSLLFGQRTTHHMVLLDDSYSMSDKLGSAAAFDQADLVLTNLAQRAAAQDTLQKITLLRYSRTERAEPTAATSAPGDVARIADLNAEFVDANFDLRLDEERRTIDVSDLAVGPGAALELTRQLAQQSPRERSMVYILSDFRADPWEQSTEILDRIKKLEQAGAKVHLVRCVENTHPNLAITELMPGGGTRAAGVPFFVDVTVKNFGTQDVAQIPITMRAFDFSGDADADEPAEYAPQAIDLPSLLIDRIAAGEAVTRRVQVSFAKPGRHVVQAELPPDSVAADNRRWCVVEMAAGVPVLVVDGDPAQRNLAFLQSVFQPSQRVETGVRPEAQTPAYLRDTLPETLARYRAIYLLDVNRLDSAAEENLQKFVRQGGGVAIFLGPNSRLDAYRQWYADGAGFFPAPLGRQDSLPPADRSPDLIVEDHPVFRALLGERNPFLGKIRVREFVATVPGWRPAEDSTTRVLARLRDGSPLVIERQWGDGHVFVVLSTFAPLWNNWATQPSFVVTLLELQSYLDAVQDAPTTRLVGTPIKIQVEENRFQPTVEFVLPAEKGDARTMITTAARRVGPTPSGLLQATLGETQAERTSGAADHPGIYEAWTRRLDGPFDVQRFALNVDPREGDLAVTPTEELAEKFDDTNVEILQFDDLGLAAIDDRGFSWSQFLLLAVVGLLAGEQLLAYSASYHPATRVKL